MGTPKGWKRKSAVLVRCLGPGKEHEFRSPDPARIRICFKCRCKLVAQHYSPTMEQPMKEGSHER